MELCLAGLIPQSLQLQAQVTLPSLTWRHKSGQCAKPCARRSVCAVRVVEVSVLVCLSSSWSHVTQVGCLKVWGTGAEGCRVKWRGLCVYNPAIHWSTDTAYSCIHCQWFLHLLVPRCVFSSGAATQRRAAGRKSVCIWKVLRPSRSITVFRGFPRS